MKISTIDSCLAIPFQEFWWVPAVVLVLLSAFFLFRAVFRRHKEKKAPDSILGFAYDEKQDIFYSAQDAWQREFGYCDLYDEAAALMGMIIDCEPVTFQYAGKEWLIELWKGQYGATTGCEIGIYVSEDDTVSIPELFSGTFYHTVDDNNLLNVSLTLYKKNKVVFSRKMVSWWITGFKLGEFSYPEELTAHFRIQFQDPVMREAFTTALERTGYTGNDFKISGNVVYIVFRTPHSEQPSTRTKEMEAFVQDNNRKLCETVNALTGEIPNSMEKLAYLQKRDPRVFRQIQNSARPKKLYSGFKQVTKVLNQKKARGDGE